MKTILLSSIFLAVTVWAQNPTTAGSDQLVINWELVQSRYNFNSLSEEDQSELLRDLAPDDKETLAERAVRLNIRTPAAAVEANQPESGPVKKNKFMVKFDKKF